MPARKMCAGIFLFSINRIKRRESFYFLRFISFFNYTVPFRNKYAINKKMKHRTFNLFITVLE